MTKRRVILWVSAVLFLGLQGVGVWQILSLRERLADAEWSIAYQVKKLEDTIIPDVGTIQFLRRGYSIEIEAAKYTADGLTLQGSVGNPLNLTLHNLTLKFTATKPLYEYRDEFRNAPFAFFFGPTPIGEAQTKPIGILMPGSTASFEVTIPNVKQTEDGIRIAVAFTGERYSY